MPRPTVPAPVPSTSQRLVANSFRQIAGQETALVQDFYARLFRRAPGVRGLFADDYSTQADKLLNALNFAVANLDAPDSLARDLAVLGRIHIGYGALPEHYPVVIEVMMDTLAAALGDAWTQELHTAWEDALTFVAQCMMEGARQVEAGPQVA